MRLSLHTLLALGALVLQGCALPSLSGLTNTGSNPAANLVQAGTTADPVLSASSTSDATFGDPDGNDGVLPGADASTVAAAPEGRESRAVLLVHGLAVGGWSLAGMQAYLVGQGFPNVHTIDLPGSGITTTIEECAAAVEQKVGELAGQGITEVDLVGHSMGGLVIREYARARKDPRVAIKTLITVATPNHGNRPFASMLGLVGIKNATTQMASNSDFIARINSTPLPAGVHGVGLRTPDDEIVSPAESCILPGGVNEEVDVGVGMAHMAMGFHQNSLARVRHHLLAAT